MDLTGAACWPWRAVGPCHQLGHQPGLPPSPGGRTGGQAVRLGQRPEQVQPDGVADRLGDGGDGGRVVEVAPGGRVGQQEVVAHHIDQASTSPAEAHAGRHAVDDLHAHAVWSPGYPLPMSWSRAPTSRVGSLDPAHELGGLRRRLQQVPVDRKAVVGVALRLVAHGGPFGDQADQQPELVERLRLVAGRPARPSSPTSARRPRAPTGRLAGACGPLVDAGTPGRWAGRSAAAAARRKASEGSVETAAVGARAISPSISTMSARRWLRECGAVLGHVSRAEAATRWRRGVPQRRRRQASSLTQAISRPASETPAISASASGNPSGPKPGPGPEGAAGPAHARRPVQLDPHGQ